MTICKVYSNDGTSAPSNLLFMTEGIRSMIDFTALVPLAPLFNRLPRGEAHPVLVIPGLNTGDNWTITLRAVLRNLGYRTYGWKLGRDIGPTAWTVYGLQSRLDYLSTRYEQPVSIIGWSLGGIFARRLARRDPEKVRQVITLGSPFRLEDENQSRVGMVYNMYRRRHVETIDALLERDDTPLPVPTTSIYSRLDGIVAWRPCLNPPGPQAENIEIYGSHLGLGHHPAVIWAVADRLAQPEKYWEAFQPPSILRKWYPQPAAATPAA